MLLSIGISWSCRNYCWFNSVFGLDFVLCPSNILYYVMSFGDFTHSQPRNYPLNQVTQGFQSLIEKWTLIPKMQSIFNLCIGTVIKGQELGISPHYHEHDLGYFERKQEENTVLFSVLFYYHSAI